MAHRSSAAWYAVLAVGLCTLIHPSASEGQVRRRSGQPPRRRSTAGIGGRCHSAAEPEQQQPVWSGRTKSWTVRLQVAESEPWIFPCPGWEQSERFNWTVLSLSAKKAPGAPFRLINLRSRASAIPL